LFVMLTITPEKFTVTNSYIRRGQGPHRAVAPVKTKNPSLWSSHEFLRRPGNALLQAQDKKQIYTDNTL
jgi:hypothetical protein